MKYEILFAPEAVQDFKRLSARDRSAVKEAIEKHLRYEPQKISKSRIKRLQGIRRPQYRLRVEEIKGILRRRGNDGRSLSDHTEVQSHRVAGGNRREEMKRVALSKVKDHLSEYLDLAEKEEVIITRHGRPAGVLVGFKSEEDWFDYRLEHDPRFLARISAARGSIQKGKGIRIEDLSD